ncbi:MAG: hypothetical protein K0S33_4192 [Bacteroidetes bacterium]|jgi:hypothetical protein|nr:hypothetical protein [Bacteroidota bacterium]
MRKFLLLFILAAISTGLGAQTVNLTWGPEMSRPKKTDISGLIGADKTSFYCLRTSMALFSRGDMALEKYNKTNMELEYVKDFELPKVNGKDLSFGAVYILQGKMLVFAFRYDKDQDKNIAYVQKVNTSDGAMIGTPKEIDYIAATKRRNSGSFDFVLSEDSSKILLLHNEPFEKYSKEKFSYKVFDANANEIWSAALELPYTDKAFTISNYRVDNDGNVFMLASIEKEKADRERKKPRYRYELISYLYKTKSVKETEISIEDKFITDVAFRINEKGNIVIGGFYSNKTSYGLAGTFFLSMDRESRKVLSSGYKDFSTEFLGEFMSARRAEKHKELYNYSIDYLVTKSDGGVYMIGEQYYMYTVTTTDPKTGATHTTYHYYYNDIIVVSVNPDASIAWVKKVPKLQHTTNDNGYYSSYSMDVVGDKLYLIYNDNPKNLLADATKVKNGITKKMVTVLATVDSKGTLERNVMFVAKEAKIFTRPKIALQLGPKESLFYAIKKKKYKFGRINY